MILNFVFSVLNLSTANYSVLLLFSRVFFAWCSFTYLSDGHGPRFLSICIMTLLFSSHLTRRQAILYAGRGGTGPLGCGVHGGRGTMRSVVGRARVLRRRRASWPGPRVNIDDDPGFTISVNVLQRRLLRGARQHVKGVSRYDLPSRGTGWADHRVILDGVVSLDGRPTTH